jgi:hypothetical protein
VTAITDAQVARLAANAAWIAETRWRLANLGWFMKCLKEPLACCTAASQRASQTVEFGHEN